MAFEPIKRIQPWRGRNPFSAEFRRLFNAVAEAAARFVTWEKEFSNWTAIRLTPERLGAGGGVAFPVRLVQAEFLETGVWRYHGFRVKATATIEGARPVYELLIQQGEPLKISNIFNRAEEWNPLAITEETDRQSYGVRARDVDNTDQFCVRLLPIGRSDDAGSFVTINPFAGEMSQPVVHVTPEPVELDDGTTVTYHFFNAGNDVDVSCCPCDIPAEGWPADACTT